MKLEPLAPKSLLERIPAARIDDSIRIAQIGDAVAGWAKPNGTEVFLVGRARNVILTIDEQRTSGLSVDQVYSPGGVASMLAYIVDRINSQAH